MCLFNLRKSLYSFKKLRFWKLEIEIILIRFNCLLEFSYMMGGKFMSTTINIKETFLPQCWISKTHCPFTGILVPLYALYSWFSLQIFNLVFWNYIDLSTRVNFAAYIGLVAIECDWLNGVCLLGDCVDLLVVIFDFIWNIKNGTNEEIVSA